MKLVKSSNQIPITAYACCKYHETTNYKVLQFLFNQSNCLITIKYSVQPIKLLNYHQTTPFNQSNGSITVHLCHNYHELSIIIVFSDYPFLFPLSPYTFYATSTAQSAYLYTLLYILSISSFSFYFLTLYKLFFYVTSIST